MPTMVMSQPPKNSGGNSLRKRQKNKNDKILAVNYMYVGAHEKQFTFYVRERLVYRSNVEVTYEDVFNYLANTTSDDSVSLHYSVNGLYVPITTTGQLHTFLHHVHKDQSALLYVENREYVWNVAPQDKSHKMEKRVPGTAAEEAEENESVNGEEENRGNTGGESELDNTQEDEEYEDEEDDYGDITPQYPPILTDTSAPTVCAQKVPVKEAFVDPKPRVVTKSKLFFSDGQSIRLGQRENADPSSSDSPPLNSRWTVKAAYNEVKDMLTDSLAKKKMGSAPERVAEKLVLNVWNPSFTHNDQVLKDTVSLLKNSIGTGILCYYHKVISKFNPERKNGDSSIEKIMLSEIMPNHDPEFLADFINSALVAACDMLESVQHLANLQIQFDYFNELAETLEKNLKANGNNIEPLPTLIEIYDHVKAAVTSAHIGFNVLDPVFSAGCECHEAIRVVTLELQKLLLVLENIQQKTSTPNKLTEAKLFTVESAHNIIKRFTEKECSQHRTIELALKGSEIYKWRNDITVGYDQWNGLRETGENRLNITTRCFEVDIVLPEPYALLPKGSVGDPDDIPVATILGDMNITPITGTITLESTEKDLEACANSFRDMSTKENAGVTKADTQKEVEIQSATANVDATTNGQSAGGEDATIIKTMSDELQRMVDKMYKNSAPPHNYVYPPPPKPGAILIPTGGLARCRCSKTCQETLMEPAYEYVERFNEPRQTVWEKTKQKRFKKN